MKRNEILTSFIHDATWCVRTDQVYQTTGDIPIVYETQIKKLTPPKSWKILHAEETGSLLENALTYHCHAVKKITLQNDF